MTETTSSARHVEASWQAYVRRRCEEVGPMRFAALSGFVDGLRTVYFEGAYAIMFLLLATSEADEPEAIQAWFLKMEEIAAELREFGEKEHL